MPTIRWSPRIVIDSMYFRGANAATIAQLERIRGKHKASIHLSMIVIAEAFARADRDERGAHRALGAVLGPLQRLRPVLDPVAPIAPCDLYRPPDARRLLQLGKRSREELRETHAMWRYLNSNDVQNHASHSATQATRLLGSRASAYLKLNQRWEHDGARKILKAFHGPDGIKVFAEFLLDSWKIAHPLLRRRFDAVARVTGLRLIRSGLGAESATENDDVDTRLLNHLIDGYAVATADEKLRRDVTACGTFQEPWVRSLDEFESEMPDKAPW